MKRRIEFSNLLLLALALATAPTALASSTWYVDGVHGKDRNSCKSSQHACKTIGHAISLASLGDSIKVAPAIYKENLTINLSLEILGSGASKTIIDGGQRDSVFNIVNPAYGTTKATISNITIRNGLAPDGGGIVNFGFLTIIECVITGNVAARSCNPMFLCGSVGGGIYNLSGKLTIIGSTLTGNSVSAYCTEGHHCFGSQGGGIYNTGNNTVAINNSTITNNSAGNTAYPNGSGGGIYDQTYSTVTNFTINNSTIQGNAATENGGGIYNLQDVLTISNSTVTDNTAPSGQGGGILNWDGSTTLQNSIVAGSSGGNCGGTITSDGYNLSSDNTCNFDGPGDLNNTKPKLGKLGNHGGPTQTIPLLAGSPAIDAGNPNGCKDGHGHLLKIDQRGKPRPDKKSGLCDMGAFDLNPA